MICSKVVNASSSNSRCFWGWDQVIWTQLLIQLHLFWTLHWLNYCGGRVSQGWRGFVACEEGNGADGNITCGASRWDSDKAWAVLEYDYVWKYRSDVRQSSTQGWLFCFHRNLDWRGKYQPFITARICFSVISLDLIKPGMAASGPVNVPTLLWLIDYSRA